MKNNSKATTEASKATTEAITEVSKPTEVVTAVFTSFAPTVVASTDMTINGVTEMKDESGNVHYNVKIDDGYVLSYKSKPLANVAAAMIQLDRVNDRANVAKVALIGYVERSGIYSEGGTYESAAQWVKKTFGYEHSRASDYVRVGSRLFNDGGDLIYPELKELDFSALVEVARLDPAGIVEFLKEFRKAGVSTRKTFKWVQKTASKYRQKKGRRAGGAVDVTEHQEKQPPIAESQGKPTENTETANASERSETPTEAEKPAPSILEMELSEGKMLRAVETAVFAEILKMLEKTDVVTVTIRKIK